MTEKFVCPGCKKAPCECGPDLIDYVQGQCEAYGLWNYYGRPKPKDGGTKYKEPGPENKRFPGRPNYTGPTKGWFGFLHHDTVFEISGYVTERVEWVRDNKAANEINGRLYNMIYVGDLIEEKFFDDYVDVYTKYLEARKPFDDEYHDNRVAAKKTHGDYADKIRPLFDALERDTAPFKNKMIELIKKHIPDLPWEHHQLNFNKLPLQNFDRDWWKPAGLFRTRPGQVFPKPLPNNHFQTSNAVPLPEAFKQIKDEIKKSTLPKAET